MSEIYPEIGHIGSDRPGWTGDTPAPAAPETAPDPQPLDTYAIVEAMGHRTLIGAVTETTIAGKPVLKVDRLDGITQYLPPESLYMLTPCTREQAEAAQKRTYGTGLPFTLAALTSGESSAWGGDVLEEDALHHEVAVGAFPDDEDGEL